MTDPSRSVGQSPEAGELRLIADDLVALLDTQTPHLIATTSRDEQDRARLYARTAVGLLRYHHWTADTSPGRMTRLVGLRGRMMADNLLALAERGPVLAHAHNAHLQREQSSMRMGGRTVRWWSAGALADARLGEEYAFLATAVGTIQSRGVAAPAPDTVGRTPARAPARPLCRRRRPSRRRTRRPASRPARVALVRLRAARPGPPRGLRRDRLRQGP